MGSVGPGGEGGPCISSILPDCDFDLHIVLHITLYNVVAVVCVCSSSSSEK